MVEAARAVIPAIFTNLGSIGLLVDLVYENKRDTIRIGEYGTVPDRTIQPTAKFIKARAIFAVLVILALEIAYVTVWNGPMGWWMALPDRKRHTSELQS